MRCLNEINGADKLCDEYEKKCLTEFEGELIGVMMGICYGGDVERLAKTWKDRGRVYGFDTFEDLHPKHLSTDPVGGFDATCMDGWYELYGKHDLSINYQREELNKMGLYNAFLRKEEVNNDSCIDIPYINYAFLDMDMLASMKSGFEAVKYKILSKGYLLLHDTYQCIEELSQWYEKELSKLTDWETIEKRNITVVMRKK